MINPLFLILQSVSGGVAGYITNKYAVNMLFKEYTPLKLGGVVKKNKDKFIDEISTLVEKDIINGNTLKEHISGEIFKEQIEKTVEEFWHTGLTDAFKEVKICDLASFTDSKEGILEFTEEKLKLVSVEALNNIIDNIELSKILPKEQINYIVESIYEIIIEYLKGNTEISEIINKIYLENDNLRLKDIINKDLEEIIKGKIKNIFLQALENTFYDNNKLTDILEKVYEVVDLDKVIYKIIEEIKDKSINSYLSIEEKDKLNKMLLENIKILLNSPTGNERISAVLNEIIKIAGDLDFTLYELLPAENAENFSSFIEEITTKVLPSIGNWILFNKNEVNNIIEESIDSSIEGMDGAIKRIIVQKVREALFSDISEKASIVDRIVSYIEEYELNEESSKKVALFIINYLKENKIKDVILKLQKDNILTESKIKSLSTMIIEKFNLHGEKLVNTVVETAVNKKIGMFINNERINKLSEKIKKNLTHLIINNKDEILSYFAKVGTKAIDSKVQELLDSEISSFIAKAEFREIAQRYSDNLPKLLKDNQEKLTAKIELIINDKISEMNLMDLLSKEKEELAEKLVKLVVKLEENVINKYSNSNVSEVISKVNNEEKIIKLTSDKIYQYLQENLETSLKGNVKKVIYDNLIEFNEEEICDLAQSFMGNELKPLSLFGGVLGLIVGLIYGAFVGNVSPLGFSGGVGATIISCLIMALIGVSTNVIALKMLFYPYKRNKFLAKIPFIRKFSLGYIPAHKDVMARGIGQVIDEQLLNGARIEEILNSKKDTVKGYLLTTIAESNYKVILDSVAIRKEQIVNYIYTTIKGSVEKNKNKLVGELGNSLDNIKVGKIAKFELINKLVIKAEKQNNIFKEKIIDYLESKIKSKQNTKELLENKYIKEIMIKGDSYLEASISKQLVDLLSEEKIKGLIDNNEEKYKLLINNSLNTIISEEKNRYIKQEIKDKSMNFIFKESKIYLENIIKEFLESEIDGEKTIGNIFGCKLALYIDMNIPKLSKYLIYKVESYLKDNKDNFSQRIRGEITANLNFLERGAYMMFGGDAIVNRCVNTIIEVKVPIFLDNKYLEISSVVQNTLIYSVYPIAISELKLKANEINCSKVLDSIFISLNDSKFIKSDIEEGLAEIITIIFNQRVDEILSIVNLNSLEGIANKFNFEIKILLKEVQENLVINKFKLKTYILALIEEEIIEPIGEMSIEELTKGINREHISYIVNSISEKLIETPKFAEKVESVLSDFYSRKLENEALSTLINKEYVVEYAEELIKTTFNKNEFNEINIKILNTIFDEMTKEQFNFIKDDSKDEIICRIIEGSLNAVIGNTSELLKAANLKKVTMEQIAIMEPREIHLLFEGFAGEFFKKLYLYGSFGAIFGVNLWLSIIWAIIEEINNKKQG